MWTARRRVFLSPDEPGNQINLNFKVVCTFCFGATTPPPPPPHKVVILIRWISGLYFGEKEMRVTFKAPSTRSLLKP